MMRPIEYEFNNRMSVQRQLLQIVNGDRQWTEELAGMSRNAIDRWVLQNQLSTEAELVKLLYDAARQLQCLATKSQEQLTAKYSATCQAVATIITEIEVLLASAQ